MRETEYAGTLSNLDHSDKSPRERRGKYRANKRKPRTYVSASACISHLPDGTSRIFTPKRRTSPVTIMQESTFDKLTRLVGSNSDVD